MVFYSTTALYRIFTVKLLKNWPFFIKHFYSGTATHNFEGIEMRVKVIVLIALAVLLIVSSVNAMASYVLTQDLSQLKTPQQGLLAQPVYTQQDTKSLDQIDSLVKNMAVISKDMYDTRGSDLLSGSTTGMPLLSGQLSEIPGPMDLISAMAPAGYGSASGLGNHTMAKNLIGTGLF